MDPALERLRVVVGHLVGDRVRVHLQHAQRDVALLGAREGHAQGERSGGGDGGDDRRWDPRTPANERDRDTGRDNAPRGEADGRRQAHERGAVYCAGRTRRQRVRSAPIDTVAGLSAVDSELQAGDVFAGYRVTGVAGRGGMGVVYEAQQLDLQRPVALKLIATPLARDEAFRERFVRESRAAAAIDHPNVIPVYSAGEDDGRLYLAMRFVDGEDLRSLVQREGPLEPARAASIIAQIGNALDAAHARGLVHRDIKPANVLLDRDHAYLTDFGLTKRLTGETTMTGSGRWVGTLGYIAPEQIRGEGVDARADVYALGCLLFYVLTGVAPYRRDSDEATLYAHLNDAAPDARALAPEVPEALAEVVARALEKDPDDRFPSAGDLGRAALAAVGDGPVPPPERVVARGAAAPGGFADDETAIPGGAGGASATPTAPTALAPGERGSARCRRRAARARGSRRCSRCSRARRSSCWRSCCSAGATTSLAPARPSQTTTTPAGDRHAARGPDRDRRPAAQRHRLRARPRLGRQRAQRPADRPAGRRQGRAADHQAAVEERDDERRRGLRLPVGDQRRAGSPRAHRSRQRARAGRPPRRLRHRGRRRRRRGRGLGRPARATDDRPAVLDRQGRPARRRTPRRSSSARRASATSRPAAATSGSPTAAATA